MKLWNKAGLVAVGATLLAAAPAAFAGDWDRYDRYGYNDQRDYRHDKRELRRDYRRMNRERAEMRQDLREGRRGEFFVDRHQYEKARRDAYRHSRDLYGNGYGW